MRLRRPLLALLAAMLVAGGAAAQTAIDDSLDEHSAKRVDNLEKVVRELRAIVFQGRETGQPVTIQPADTQAQISALSDRVNDLDHSLTGMNGQLEVMRHDLDQVRSENGDLKAQNAALKAQVDDIAQKLAAANAPPPAPVAAPPPGSAPATPPPTDDAAAAFAAAHSLWLSGDMTGAEGAFHDYTDRYSGSPRDPEAHYFLAKTLLARQAWPEAATADIGAIRGWPQTRWAPDAVVDLARALVAMNKNQDACGALGELGRRYPKAPLSVAKDAKAMRAQAACGAP